MRKLLATLLIGILLYPLSAVALWTGDTSFETTDGSTTPTDGNDVAGGGDGSGWSGNWTEGNGSYTGYHDYDDDVADIPDGSWVLHMNASGVNVEPELYRDLSSGSASGEIQIYLRFNKTDRDFPRIDIRNSGTNVMAVYFAGAQSPTQRDVNARDGGSWSELASDTLAKDTWYKLELDYDCTSETYDVYIDDVKQNSSGALDFWNSASTVNRMLLWNVVVNYPSSSTGSQHFWDFIDDANAGGDPPATPAGYEWGTVI